MLICEILDDGDEDYINPTTMACDLSVVALRLATQPTTLPYKPTDVTPADVGDKKFKVTLHGVESVTDDTGTGDVQVSCPPENSHGCFLIVVHDRIRCQTGPGFPDVEGTPDVKVNTKKQKITVTLKKATRGSWIQTWHDLRKKPR